MGYLQDEKVTTNVISNEKEVIHILDHELKNDNPSFTSSEETSDIEGYVPDLQWTEEEEKKILRAIDIKLMPFVLLMNFVLNMDRTNNCKFFCCYKNQLNVSFDKIHFIIKQMLFRIIYLSIWVLVSLKLILLHLCIRLYLLLLHS